MTVSLSLFLYIYLFLLLIWLIFSFIALYHMFKFGFKNFTTFFTTFLYIAVSIVLLLISYNYIIQIDWSHNIPLFGGFFGGEMPF